MTLVDCIPVLFHVAICNALNASWANYAQTIALLSAVTLGILCFSCFCSECVHHKQFSAAQKNTKLRYKALLLNWLRVIPSTISCNVEQARFGIGIRQRSKVDSLKLCPSIHSVYINIVVHLVVLPSCPTFNVNVCVSYCFGTTTACTMRVWGRTCTLISRKHCVWSTQTGWLYERPSKTGTRRSKSA